MKTISQNIETLKASAQQAVADAKGAVDSAVETATASAQQAVAKAKGTVESAVETATASAQQAVAKAKVTVESAVETATASAQQAVAKAKVSVESAVASVPEVKVIVKDVKVKVDALIAQAVAAAQDPKTAAVQVAAGAKEVAELAAVRIGTAAGYAKGFTEGAVTLVSTQLKKVETSKPVAKKATVKKASKKVVKEAAAA